MFVKLKVFSEGLLRERSGLISKQDRKKHRKHSKHGFSCVQMLGAFYFNDKELSVKMLSFSDVDQLVSDKNRTNGSVQSDK